MARLELLKRAKLLGLTLPELSSLLRAADEAGCDVDPPPGKLLRKKLEEIDRHIAELQALRATLHRGLIRLERRRRLAVADPPPG